MRVSGICSKCTGVANPAYSCHLCGAIVCRKCFVIEQGICKVCTSGKR